MSVSSLFDLKGKVAVVTGSSRGIGEAIADRLAEHGAKVVGHESQARCVRSSRQTDQGEGRRSVRTRVQHRSQRRSAGPRQCRDSEMGRHRCARLQCRSESVLRAGDRHVGRCVRQGDEQQRAQQLLAVQHGTAADGGARRWLDHHRLFDRRTARFAVIGVYGISKAADMALARNIAVEWGPKNIRANCIAPGLVRTDFAKALWENKRSTRKP